MRGDKGARMANAMAVVAGRAARSCDVCARKRSRWYCAADEAYLCEECDSSVHAANALAFRHERVRLTANGAPMKMDRRSNVNHGDMPHHSAPTTTNKKKAKAHRPGSNSTPSAAGAAPFQPLQQTEKYNLGENNRGLREVKLELTPGNCGANDTDASDDHFTAEELTGNANLLDDPSSMCPPTYDGSANGDYSHGMTHGEGDFAHDFLVSDPNDPHSNSHRGGSGTPSSDILTSSSVGGGDGMDQYEDEEDEEDGDCVGNEWMDLANRDLTGDDDYCIDPTALRDSISAPDQVIPHYSHDEKPDLHGDGGVSPSFHGKAFKNSWAKPEGGGYGNYGFAPHQHQQALNGSACKVEGLPMSGGDLRLVPTLRLNYEDVLSSWPNRGMMWTDDGSGSQLVPDDSNSDMGSCYDLGLVPDLSSGGCGVDGSGHLASMYGCGSGGVGGCGMGDDGMISAGNAREARVSRYREKRRTRLFSKKIRYEVRKLNAERRPRMKGRFVKRSPGRDS